MVTGDKNGHATSDSEVKTDIITLTRFLTEAQHELGSYATGDFTYALPRHQMLQNITTESSCIKQTAMPRPSILIQEYCVSHPPVPRLLELKTTEHLQQDKWKLTKDKIL